jgi:hypothetical protein
MLDEMPPQVWVEGLAGGVANLSLDIHSTNSTATLFTDEVWPVGGAHAATTGIDTVLITLADLTAYRPMHTTGGYGLFEKTAVPEEDEQSATRGPGIRINNDDDNGNELADRGESNQVFFENDLIEVQIELPEGQSGLVLETPNVNDLLLWTTADKGESIPFPGGGLQTGELQSATGSLTIFVEWINSNHGSSDLRLVHQNTGTVIDTLTFHSFKTIVVALGGENQSPKLPRNNGMNDQGIFVMADPWYYEEGYDVFYWNEDKVNSSGIKQPLFCKFR